MRSGPLRLRGVLQARGEETLDGVQWTTVAPVWFSTNPIRGDQRVAGESIQNAQLHAIKMRYRAGVDATMRIRMGRAAPYRIFDFVSVNDVEGKHKEWQIEALEGVSNG